jgi:hypothetical protein
MRFPLLEPEFGWGDGEEAGPQTESAREREFVGKKNDLDECLGHSDSLDFDDVGDVADEGPGHRA